MIEQLETALRAIGLDVERDLSAVWPPVVLVIDGGVAFAWTERNVERHPGVDLFVVDRGVDVSDPAVGLFGETEPASWQGRGAPLAVLYTDMEAAAQSIRALVEEHRAEQEAVERQLPERCDYHMTTLYDGDCPYCDGEDFQF